jgi:hypothetical protein
MQSPPSRTITSGGRRRSPSGGPRTASRGGDPAKLARALITLTGQGELPRRFLAGADAIDIAEQKIALLRQQIEAHRELSRSLAID